MKIDFLLKIAFRLAFCSAESSESSETRVLSRIEYWVFIGGVMRILYCILDGCKKLLAGTKNDQELHVAQLQKGGYVFGSTS